MTPASSVDCPSAAPRAWYSARYAGSDPERISRLLAEWRATPLPQCRGSIFALAPGRTRPERIVLESDGSLPGKRFCWSRSRAARAAMATNSVFYVREAGPATYAEMSDHQLEAAGQQGPRRPV